MSKLSYRTIADERPQGKPKVYFSCHADDFEQYFDEYAVKILRIQDCAIWYESEPEADYNREDLELNLSQMQLFVMPVTAKLLTEPCRAIGVELPLAKEKHIPVLPLMRNKPTSGVVCPQMWKNGLLNKPTSGVVCPQMWKNGLLDEQTTLEVTFRGKDPKMKKLLTKSIIAAFAIEIIGAAANLISYAVNGRFLLAKQLFGGEWMGWSGFGMLLNRTYPMSSQDHPVSGSTWISFDPGSLVMTLLAGFVIGFIFFGIISLAKKKQ